MGVGRNQMTELQWIESRFQRFAYLYAQAFGNLAGEAYRLYRETGQAIDHKQIAQHSAQLAEAGLLELERVQADELFKSVSHE